MPPIDEEGVGQASPPEPGPAAVPPGGGWWGVTAVLAVGVIPPLPWGFIQGFAKATHPPAPYWEDTLTLTTASCCTAFVVLYLIHRSGEPWRHFGIVRPRLSDFLFFGPALVLFAWQVWDLRWVFIPQLD